MSCFGLLSLIGFQHLSRDVVRNRPLFELKNGTVVCYEIFSVVLIPTLCDGMVSAQGRSYYPHGEGLILTWILAGG